MSTDTADSWTRETAHERVRPEGGCPLCPDCNWSKCGGGRA